ncbi:hypothetical protein SCHPADRAFT_875932 [Schizopora paradoxa]|uniref:Calcium-channel protein CCH1 n=1 Tax=Schizopora paradoxa TaxID=27342 RepID=A0A0H2RJC7_9AGAM|nr:hypothetical protein SCHPADRAFT_875932 [Schizopora paradoxa]
MASGVDIERTSDSSRRRSARYSMTPSPASRLKSMKRTLRRVSMRVVNLKGRGLDERSYAIRLPDDNGNTNGDGKAGKEELEEEDMEEDLPDLETKMPLRGRTLGFLDSSSQLRYTMFRVLTQPWTEPVILLLIIVNAIVLTVQAARSLTLPDSSGDNTSRPPPVHGYFHSWEDYVLFVMFILFSLEALARIVTTGFILDPEVPISALFKSPFSSVSATYISSPAAVSQDPQHTSFTNQSTSAFGVSVGRSNSQNGRTFNSVLRQLRRNIVRPFALAHHHEQSTSIIDPMQSTTTLTATPSANTLTEKPSLGNDEKEYLGLPFRLSVYTAQDHIVRNVPYLRHSWNRIDFIAILCFWVTFGLAEGGIERGSFEGSFRRSCYLSATLGQPNISLSDQRCGGFIDPQTLNVTGYITEDNTTSPTAKGYICPLGQVCMEQANPQSGLESFDTIYFAALQVVIVASANGWAPIMYDMIDSEFFVSCFFFIILIVVLNFWLINLFVAVITNTFSAIRSDTKKSAFGAAPLGPILEEQEEEYGDLPSRQMSRSTKIKVWYDRTKWIWVLFAMASVILQATRSAESSPMHIDILNWSELALAFLFDIDIFWRFMGYFPNWRTFFDHGNNWLDLILAFANSIIQIPAIRNSEVYPWLTLFQLTRFYRVILEVPRMRPLLMAVFGNLYGLVNMSLFLILANFLSALVAVQLVRGDLTQDETMNFGEIYNSFIAMYQVLSSENWTDVLYKTAVAEIPLGQSALLAIFITGWFLFANFILVQLFIAVINENFDVAEELKKGKQTTHYLAMQQPVQASPPWLRRLNPYRWMKSNPKAVVVENLPSNLVLSMQKSIIQDQSFKREGNSSQLRRGSSILRKGYTSRPMIFLQNLFSGEARSDEVPLATLRVARRDSLVPQDPNEDELERHLELLASINADDTDARDVNDVLYERRAQKADFIRAHPSYDKTFWIFSQKNRFRRYCQLLVRPANGERIFGTPYSPTAHTLFQLILLLTVIGGIVVEGVATPIYRRNFYMTNGYVRGSWFDIAEASFGLTLFVEFLIKIVADGFLFTPNAYMRSIWNAWDLLILAGVLVNLTTGLIFIGGLSRLTRSLKALRALRLITLIDRMRSAFQYLIFSGAMRIMDAALLAILYMIPYAVWGLNIFNGLLNECNDGNANGLTDCVNEYTTNPVLGDSFGFLVPRVWDNPSPSTTFSFDNFRSSLLILFEIVSLEGWVDVMGVATSATGRNLQPQTNASQANAIFFLIYNLLGAVVILTLFVSIIIGNFSSKTGIALLTKAQREWIDLQKLIKRQRPSKRPKQRPTWPLRAWCYDRAVHKHGWWSRMMTFLFVVHIFALTTQTLSTQNVADTLRNVFFLAITLIYLVDICVRWFGLGFRSFRANGWNIFDVIVASGSLITTIIQHAEPERDSFVIAQLQKLFLVSIAFKLVQRTNSLNQLFKTAIGSLPVILSLLALWFILFLFFGILFVEVFSLTKWQSAETRTQNYSSLGSALVMLAFMSTGEGWNEYMHDYTLVYPRCTPSSVFDPDSDCGSSGWAYTLFIAWNLLSMYIFVNMFTGVVVESFSYVFQLVGGAKSITREEMRSFKKVWAEFANPRTGYLEKHQIVRFFAKLSGVFEVRIYPSEFGIRQLLQASEASSDSWRSVVVEGIDINKLNKLLGSVDNAKIRKRRAVYSRLYHEAMISQEPGKGISFTNMLLMLAHHKLIDDREALVLKDLVTRTEINKFVNDLVNLDRVRSLLKTIYYRRKFLAAREERIRQSKIEQQGIPEIVVEDMPSTPLLSTRDITQANRDSMGYFGDSPSPLNSPSPYQSPEFSLQSESPSRPSRGLRRNRRVSDMTMLSTDLGYQYQLDNTFSRDSHDMEESDPQHVLSSMQNSIWGEMMLQAAEDH